ncbi:MAG: helix-turn-helix transcriptional regulator [Gemmatimonadota bacterium]|nr:helix-turn-helix transcriptional regulator [Gemmatimonadota bacterium]
MLHLSSADLAIASEASRVILAPLRYERVDEWRAAVNKVLVRLLKADSAGFLLPVENLAPMFSEEHSAEALAPFPDLLPPDTREGVPIWERMTTLGCGTLAQAYGESMSDYVGSAYYNDYAAAGGGAETLFAALPLRADVSSPAGAASLHLWHGRSSRRTFGDREVALLRLLLPSFTAGVQSWRRFATHRGRLGAMLDELDRAVMVCDPNGRLVHVSASLVRLLAEDPEASLVMRSMEALAQPAARLTTQNELMRVAKSISTTRCRYEALTCVWTDGDDPPMMLVSLTRRASLRATRNVGIPRLALTPQENRIATLVSEGRRNGDIAHRLGISEHTVKRHVEQVLRKLQIRSRAGVARALDQAE